MLVDAALEKSLVTLFEKMEKLPMSSADYAKELAAAITQQIKTAEVAPGIATPMGATTGTGKLI